MAQTWILVADGSHARLFHAADAQQDWRLVSKLDREHSREKMDGATQKEDKGEADFAKTVTDELESKRQAGNFSRLVIVAPPKFLGQLRGELPPPLEACVIRSKDADYTNLSADELAKRLDIS